MDRKGTPAGSSAQKENRYQVKAPFGTPVCTFQIFSAWRFSARKPPASFKSASRSPSSARYGGSGTPFLKKKTQERHGARRGRIFRTAAYPRLLRRFLWTAVRATDFGTTNDTAAGWPLHEAAEETLSVTYVPCFVRPERRTFGKTPRGTLCFRESTGRRTRLNG